MIEEAIHIRPATVADIERLIPLINAAFSVETFMQAPRTDAERLTESLNKGTVLVAEDTDGRLLASIYLEVRKTRGYMGMLAVEPSHQRRGLGRRMIRAAEKFLYEEGCVAVDITVLSLRPELLPLYRKMGFIQTGTEDFVYPYALKDNRHCHCIVMSKWLEDVRMA